MLGLERHVWYKQTKKVVRSILKQGGEYALECTEIKGASCVPTQRANSVQNPLQRFACEMV